MQAALNVGPAGDAAQPLVELALWLYMISWTWQLSTPDLHKLISTNYMLSIRLGVVLL